jgi:hypothetical protein
VSDHLESDRSRIGQSGTGQAEAVHGDTEEIDALPVLAEEEMLVRAYRLPSAPATYWKSTTLAIPAVQAAAVAAGGFVAGAAFVGLAHRRHRRPSVQSGSRRSAGRGSREKRAGSKAGELVQIVSSRSLLVDVHLLGGRD